MRKNQYGSANFFEIQPDQEVHWGTLTEVFRTATKRAATRGRQRIRVWSQAGAPANRGKMAYYTIEDITYQAPR